MVKGLGFLFPVMLSSHAEMLACEVVTAEVSAQSFTESPPFLHVGVRWKESQCLDSSRVKGGPGGVVGRGRGCSRSPAQLILGPKWPIARVGVDVCPGRLA